MQFPKFYQLLAFLVMLLATLGLGYGVEQSSFPRIICCYGAFFFVYIWQVNTAKPADLTFWIGVAILLRLALVGAFPALSDDIYRFVWDGRLWLAGQNPFDHLPVWYLEEGHHLPGLGQALFNELNSPEYYTIYPPVAQGLFAFACWLSPNSVWGAAVVMQVFLLLMEVGTIFLLLALLREWGLPASRVLWYALNPLIIVEVVGNLHFEGAMIFFLLLGLWLLLRWWREGKGWTFFASAGAMALAVASKLLPLLFFPFLIRRLGWKRSFGYFTILGVILMLTWWPLVSSVFLKNFGSSVNLYFQQFEFNGSLYYVIRWVGLQVSGFNLIRFIGPVLAILVFVTITGRALQERASEVWAELPGRWLFAIGIYLFCATTVHPWYTALPLVLCLFTPYRWPVVWSGMILLTYINYSYPEYYENLWIVGLEYIVVLLWGTWEVWTQKEANRFVN
ncbi:hypothetical protein [Lewinella cohaerens]|uniref:hypothetical protein n=1 Tax=Lewinella cohaerens TaxID=70995 RepID=UPI0003648C3C|nr:hypothetical protein [Lewinella cohaerens]